MRTTERLHFTKDKPAVNGIYLARCLFWVRAVDVTVHPWGGTEARDLVGDGEFLWYTDNLEWCGPMVDSSDDNIHDCCKRAMEERTAIHNWTSSIYAALVSVVRSGADDAAIGRRFRQLMEERNNVL